MDPTSNPYTDTNPLSPYAQNPIDLLRRALMGGASGYTGNQQPAQPGSTTGLPAAGSGGGSTTPNYNSFGNTLGTSLGRTIQAMMQRSATAQPTAPQGSDQATYEGNIPTQANPANANGTMGVLGPQSPVGGSIGPNIMSDPGAAAANATSQMPLPQSNPNGVFQGNMGLNPAGPDAMTQALMQPMSIGPQSPSTVAGSIPGLDPTAALLM